MPPSEATLTRLHADHAVSVYRFAWSVTKDEGLAQEVVQELFLKLARDAEAVMTARSERAVIFTMVRNLSLDALRRRQREEKALEAWEQELPGWFEPEAYLEADWCGYDGFTSGRMPMIAATATSDTRCPARASRAARAWRSWFAHAFRCH
jgi:DNA-directed RNA polymerase specialized sigma24 family protein